MVWFVVDYGILTMLKASASAFVVAENVGGAGQMRRNLGGGGILKCSACFLGVEVVDYDNIRFSGNEPFSYAFTCISCG